MLTKIQDDKSYSEHRLHITTRTYDDGAKELHTVMKSKFLCRTQ